MVMLECYTNDPPPLRLLVPPKPRDQIQQIVLAHVILLARHSPLLCTLPFLARINIETPSKPLPEPPQSTRLILLHIQQLLTTRIPKRSVLRIFCRSVHGLRRRGTVQVGRAVGEGDELRKGVGAFGALDEGCVADLLGEERIAGG